LTLQYLSGDLAVDLMAQLPMKSGRRRILISEEHCQMTLGDLDLERFLEYSTGMIRTLKIFPQNFILNEY